MAPCAACGQSIACPEHLGLIIDGRPLCGGCLAWADVTPVIHRRWRWSFDYAEACAVVTAIEECDFETAAAAVASLSDDLRGMEEVRTYFTAHANNVCMRTGCYLCGSAFRPGLLEVRCGPIGTDEATYRPVCDSCTADYAPRMSSAVAAALEPLEAAYGAGAIDEQFYLAHLSHALTAHDVERLADDLTDRTRATGSSLAVVK